MLRSFCLVLFALLLAGCDPHNHEPQPQPQPTPLTKGIDLRHTMGPAGNQLPLDLRVKNIAVGTTPTVMFGEWPARVVALSDSLIRIIAPPELKNAAYNVTLSNGTETFTAPQKYRVVGAGLIATGLYEEGILLIDPRLPVTQPYNKLTTPAIEGWGIFLATQQQPEGICYATDKLLYNWQRGTNIVLKLETEELGYVTGMAVDEKRKRTFIARYGHGSVEILVYEVGDTKLKRFYAPSDSVEMEMEIDQLEVDSATGDLFFTHSNFKDEYRLRRVDRTGTVQRYSYSVASGSDYDDYSSFACIPGTDSILRVVIESRRFTGVVQKARLQPTMTWQTIATLPEQRWIMPAMPIQYDAASRSLYIGDYTGRLLRLQIDRGQTEELFRIGYAQWFHSLGLLN